MTQRTSRRQFLTNAGAAGAGFWIAGRQVGYGQEKSPNAKLNIACIGTGGQGGSDMGNVSSENIVAICDIDDKRNDEAAKKHPNAKKYFDYRKMLEEMAKEIDAVTVGTPDHHHAPAAIMAMKLGKGVYVQKPMAHTVQEARVMRETAAKYKVATQMGNQGSAGGNLRESVEIVQAGLIGDVKEVHLWTNRPIWPQAPDITAGRRTRPRFPPTSIGTSGWAPRPSGPIIPRTSTSSGAAGGTSARAPWATWRATRRTFPTGRSNWARPPRSRRSPRRSIPKPARAGRRSPTNSPPAARCRR